MPLLHLDRYPFDGEWRWIGLILIGLSSLISIAVVGYIVWLSWRIYGSTM